MQFKSITAIIVLLLVVASLLVAGCTTSTTSNTNQTPSATTSTETHNATLENYLAAVKYYSYADKNFTIKAWEVTWINSTSARLEYTPQNKTTNVTSNEVGTYTIFPTTQTATQYIDDMNKTNYSLASTVYPGGGYQNATGHAPTVYKYYQWNEGSPFNLSEYRLHSIIQFDNLIKVSTVKQLAS